MYLAVTIGARGMQTSAYAERQQVISYFSGPLV